MAAQGPELSGWPWVRQAEGVGRARVRMRVRAGCRSAAAGGARCGLRASWSTARTSSTTWCSGQAEAEEGEAREGSADRGACARQTGSSS